MDHTKNPSEASEIEKFLVDDAYALKCSCMVGKKEKIRPKPDFSDFC